MLLCAGSRRMLEKEHHAHVVRLKFECIGERRGFLHRPGKLVFDRPSNSCLLLPFLHARTVVTPPPALFVSSGCDWLKAHMAIPRL